MRVGGELDDLNAQHVAAGEHVTEVLLFALGVVEDAGLRLEEQDGVVVADLEADALAFGVDRGHDGVVERVRLESALCDLLRLLLDELVDLLGGELSHRPVEVLALVVRSYAVAERFFCGELAVDPKRRVDAQPSPFDLVHAVLLSEQFAHVLGEEWRDPEMGLRLGGVREVRDDFAGATVLGLLDKALLPELLEHERAPFGGALGVTKRRVSLRRLREASERGSLSERELAGALAVVVSRGLFHPVDAVTEVDRVEVEVEDVLLGQVLLELPREDDLLDLALDGALGREHEVLDDLLRDRRGALHADVETHGVVERADHAEPVDPLVLHEIGILGGHEGVAHVQRDLFQRDDGAPRATRRTRGCRTPPPSRRSGHRLPRGWVPSGHSWCSSAHCRGDPPLLKSSRLRCPRRLAVSAAP